MDDLLDLEFQIKAGMDILKELEELYTSDPEKEETEAKKLAVLMRGYLQSIPLILPTDTMIMLEVEDQQDKCHL